MLSRHSRATAALVGVALACLTAARSSRADYVMTAATYVGARRPLVADVLLTVFPNTPDVRQNSLGLFMEVAREPAVGQDGILVRAGFAAEVRTDCGLSQRCPFTRFDDLPYRLGDRSLVPPSHGEGGGHVRVGVAFKVIRVEAGVLAYSFTYLGGTPRPPNFVDFRPTVGVVPDVVFKVENRGVIMAAGFGTFAPTTLLLPGSYLQLGYTSQGQLSAVVTGGYVDVLGYGAARADVELALHLGAKLRVGQGFGFTWARRSETSALGGDLRLQVSVKF